MHRVARITSIALITAGIVILADVGLTLVWTEPVSAIYGEIRQSQADGDLDELADEFREANGLTGEGALSPARAESLARSYGRAIEPGDAIGRIRIERTGTNLVFVEDTEADELRVGPGRYTSTALPGAGKTVGIAGHRTTYGAPFHEIDAIRRGDEIELEMPYGDFTYSVIGTETVDPSDVEVLDDAASERLVLTACHPLYSAAERYVVTARLVEASS